MAWTSPKLTYCTWFKKHRYGCYNSFRDIVARLRREAANEGRLSTDANLNTLYTRYKQLIDGPINSENLNACALHLTVLDAIKNLQTYTILVIRNVCPPIPSFPPSYLPDTMSKYPYTIRFNISLTIFNSILLFLLGKKGITIMRQGPRQGSATGVDMYHHRWHGPVQN